jgi:phage repressor protein C with HTH and peptisase S24 domain
MEKEIIQKEEILKEEIPKMKEKKVEKVTKEKSPGRVAAGKRLAESNRLKRLEEKNKQEKEKIIHKETILKEEDEEPQNKTIEKPTEKNISDISILLLVGVVGGGFYFGNKLIQKWKTNQSSLKIETKETTKFVNEKPDPFYME